MCLAKEPVGIQWHLEHVGELPVILWGINTGAQHDAVGFGFNRFREIRAIDGNSRVIPIGNDRRSLTSITDKDYAGFTCLLVVFFTETIGPYIPVKHKHINPGILFFHFKSIFNRHGAAETAAIGSLVVTRAGALNHHYITVLVQGYA